MEGKILLWNSGAVRIFGFSATEAVGQSLDLIIPIELREAHWRGFHRAMAEGRTKFEGRAMTTKSFRRDGKKIYVDLSFSILKSSKGEIEGALALARESTERYNAEKTLRAELRELKKKPSS
jgi:PAS domain S-box-containing protein